MVVAMMRGALVWLSTIWWRRASALDLGSKVVWHGAAPKKCNGSKRGEHFHGGGETHGLHFGFEDDGHGVSGLGLQWIQKNNQFHGGNGAHGLDVRYEGDG